MKTFNLLSCASLLRVAFSVVVIQDPGDYVDLDAPATVAANALLADYNITAVMYQTAPIVGPYEYKGKTETLSYKTLSVDKNDTSVVVITHGSKVTLRNDLVIKSGYGTNLFQESFFGTNAAINVANASTAVIENLNVTVLEGGANIYSYGTDTVAYVYNSDLYSAGPTSHGLYASGNGTIYGYNIRHYSGGNRASSFSGDNPAGYIHVTDAVAHTAGIGSAIFYCLGEIYATNVVGHTEQAPVLFADGVQKAVLTNVDLTSDFLAGMVMFSSMDRQAGASFSLNQSILTTTAANQSALWFGNVIASYDIISSAINTTSGILVTANKSQVTQEFNHFVGYEESTTLSPAEATVTVSDSTLNGTLLAMNESSISWTLQDHSSWTGNGATSRGVGYLAVHLDSTSTWSLTADTTLQNFTDGDKSLSNVKSNGYNIYYFKNSTANSWLNGKTRSLNGGGKLEPVS